MFCMDDCWGYLFEVRNEGIIAMLCWRYPCLRICDRAIIYCDGSNIWINLPTHNNHAAIEMWMHQSFLSFEPYFSL